MTTVVRWGLSVWCLRYTAQHAHWSVVAILAALCLSNEIGAYVVGDLRRRVKKLEDRTKSRFLYDVDFGFGPKENHNDK
jgi:hypothetical protein